MSRGNILDMRKNKMPTAGRPTPNFYLQCLRVVLNPTFFGSLHTICDTVFGSVAQRRRSVVAICYCFVCVLLYIFVRWSCWRWKLNIGFLLRWFGSILFYQPSRPSCRVRASRLSIFLYIVRKNARLVATKNYERRGCEAISNCKWSVHKLNKSDFILI